MLPEAKSLLGQRPGWQLTGEHPVIPGAKKPFSWHCGNFRYSARPLRAFLRQQAEINLARHGITEPVTWEPPDDWAAWPAWPGTSPASLSGGDADAVLAGTGSVHEAASALTLTPEHVRLYCEIASTGPSPATSNGLPVSPSRADVLAPAQAGDNKSADRMWLFGLTAEGYSEEAWWKLK